MLSGTVEVSRDPVGAVTEPSCKRHRHFFPRLDCIYCTALVIVGMLRVRRSESERCRSSEVTAGSRVMLMKVGALGAFLVVFCCSKDLPGSPAAQTAGASARY